MAAHSSTTKMSPKGRVVIPESVRNELGLKGGAQFLVLGHGDTVMLKVVSPLSSGEWEAGLRRLREKARSAGRTKKDVAKILAEVRSRR